MRPIFRTFSSHAVKILSMPQLSPTMRYGKIEEVHLIVGQLVKSYDLCLRVSTKQLVSSAEESQELEIEIVEDDYTCKAILAKKGDTLNVGDPIAVLIDCTETPSITVEQVLANVNVYEKAMWQGYSTNKSPSCGCS